MRIGFLIKNISAYYAHVRPFVESNNEHQIIILHLNKYFGNLALQEVFEEDLEIVDLTEVYNVKRKIEEIKLNVIVLFSPGNIYEQLLISASRALNIPTLYFQHGVNPNYKKTGTNFGYKFKHKKLFPRLRKYLFFYLCYLIFLIKHPSNQNLKALYIRTFGILKLDKNAIHRNYGLHINHPDYAMVYNQDDKNILINYLAFPAENIFILGYPFMSETKVNYSVPHDYILYLSSGLRAAGVVNISKEAEVAFLKQIKDACFQNKKKLIIKTHPLDDYDFINKHLVKNEYFELVRDFNLADLVRNSLFVVGDYSSALFYAVKYYKPIIILSYDFISEYNFELTEYNIGLKIHISDMREYINSEYLIKSIDKNVYNNFLLNELNYDGKNHYQYFFEQLNKIII